MIQVHHFDNEVEAYDASQCWDEINDGDILHVSSGVIGILIKAWPTWVRGPEPEEFHRIKDGESWETIEGGKYLPSVELAKTL